MQDFSIDLCMVCSSVINSHMCVYLFVFVYSSSYFFIREVIMMLKLMLK